MCGEAVHALVAVQPPTETEQWTPLIHRRGMDCISISEAEHYMHIWRRRHDKDSNNPILHAIVHADTETSYFGPPRRSIVYFRDEKRLIDVVSSLVLRITSQVYKNGNLIFPMSLSILLSRIKHLHSPPSLSQCLISRRFFHSLPPS